MDEKEKQIKSILNELKKGESQNIEFKESLKLIKEIGATISAFSNSGGGTVYIGIPDKGKIIGVDIGSNTIENLANQIKTNTDPQIYPEIEIKEIHDKKIILIKVKESIEKPVFYKNHAYQRIGKSTHLVETSQIRKLAKESGEKIYWDEQVCERATIDDIDEEKVKWFLKKAKYERNIGVEPETPVIEALERLELIKNSKLTNAAILLFGKKPQTFFYLAEVRCARFKGNEPVKPFLDMKIFKGNIIEQVDKSLNFALEHIPMRVYLTGKPEREEKYQYPPDAIREGIINCICHRDYEIAGNVQIRVFDDRIELWGCGLLPKPLMPEDLKKKHKSILRNPLIAKCFFLINYVEQWGTGTNDMIQMCIDYDLPEPLFENIAGNLVVTFRKTHITEKTTDNLNLNERQIRIIKYINKNREITTGKCADLLNVSADTALRELSKLMSLGLVKQEGIGRSIHYVPL